MRKDEDPVAGIEAALERDRVALAAALGDLRQSLSLGALVPKGLSAVAGAENPLGKIAGAGLAMATGGSGAGSALLAAAGAGLAGMIVRRNRREPPMAPAVDQRLADLFAPEGVVPGRDELWMAEADRLRSQAADMLDTIERALEAGIAPEADLKARRAEVLAALAADVRRVMSQDLAGLEAAERARVFERREALYARHLGLDTGGSGWLKPVLTGAALAGVGALIAMNLPRSGAEDRMFSGLGERLREGAEALRGSGDALGGVFGEVLLSLLGEQEQRAPEGEEPEDEPPLA